MNELIKELATQAYEDVIRNTPSFLVTKEIYEEKFAELIVQECASLFPAEYDTVEGKTTIGKTIKNHFGLGE